MTGALSGIRVLDLSRVLAGPVATQILGDLGAEVIKIERPGPGDDTRAWGPPFLKDSQGHATHESAYYLSANRNKKSVAVDIATPQGQKIIHDLIPHCDVLVENFKVGGLSKYNLAYDQLKDRYPHLIYASITGFGQNGPLSSEPGYDFITQGMGGLMSVTGAVNGGPVKAGVAISDYTAGLYTVIGILSALRVRDITGVGQHVDIALLDSTLAMMTNVAQYYLTSGSPQPRVGNAHATIVPYQEFETLDGHVIVAVGNDHQFRVFARALGAENWADDPHFATNAARVQNRDTLLNLIRPVMAMHTTTHWVQTLRDVDVPVGPILNMDQVFAEPQVMARDMRIALPHPALSGQTTDVVGSPLKLSGTPVAYHTAPPMLGADTEDVLKNVLNMPADRIKDLRAQGVVG
jgi:crotonobetainyl-CoA:carnitine CoA-transferase CaiB-like acyl-CoA transferase